MMMNSDMPTLPAWDTGIHYVIWCEFCDWWHYHGRIDGHRGADCFDRHFAGKNDLSPASDSPYFISGYNIKCVGQFQDLAEEIKGRRYRSRINRSRPSRPTPEVI